MATQLHSTIPTNFHSTTPTNFHSTSKVMGETLLTLAALHEKTGVVHRDVKPQNLMLQGCSCVCVCVRARVCVCVQNLI